MQPATHLIAKTAILHDWEYCFITGGGLADFGIVRASLAGVLFDGGTLAVPIREGATLMKLRGLRDTLLGELTT